MRWPPLILALVLASAGAETRGQRLWTLDGSAADARALREAGADPMGRLPDGRYLFDLAGADRPVLQRSGARLVPWRPEWPRTVRSGTGSGPARLELLARPGVSADALAAAVTRLAPSATLTGRHPHPRNARLTLSGPPAVLDPLIDGLLDNELLLAVGPAPAPPVPLNNQSIEPLQSNCGTGPRPSCTISPPLDPGLTPIWAAGIDGRGEIIGVADSGLDRNEDWFTEIDSGGGVVEAVTDAEATQPPEIGTVYPDRKVVGYWISPGATAYDESQGYGHGTHVTGTAAGDRDIPGAHDFADGHALGAAILFQDIGIGDNLAGLGGAPLWSQARAGGARVHNNSYGAPPTDIDYVSFNNCVPGDGPPDHYTAGDAEVDDFLWRNPDMAIVFAAGNCGDPATIFHPGAAKNVITVGALEHGPSLIPAVFSSRGPAADGRIKPDLAAPGQSIRSALSNTNNTVITPPATLAVSGTSFASPAVAGLAALARQYLREGRYPSGQPVAGDARRPSAALVKALLIAGAENAGFADTPSMTTGWGRPWLDRSLYFAGDPAGVRFWDVPGPAGLAEGESHDYTVNVPPDDELRVALVWTDPAPLPGGVALVNDLDLGVTPAAGGPYLGNVFAAGESTTGGQPDRLNNVEGVVLRSPPGGPVTLTVSAPAVPGTGEAGSARQGYALVVSSAACEGVVAAAPTLDPLATDAAGIHLTLSSLPPGAQGYTIERASGGCPAQPAGFQWRAQSAGPAFSDDDTEGGLEYAYRVRGFDGCGEGPASQCRSVVSAAECNLAADFGNAAPAVAADPGLCVAELTWAPGSPGCPLAQSVRYEVHRGTDPYAEPTASLAAGLAAHGLVDDAAAPGLTHFYQVRAVDDLGNPSPWSPAASYASVAADTQPGTYLDPLEDGDTGTRELLALASLQAPWQITDLRDADDTFAYHNGPDLGGYPSGTCASLSTPAMTLGAGAGLDYQAAWQLETGYDGVVVEISDDGGASWQDLPPQGGYPGDFSSAGSPPGNACGFGPGRGAFSGESAGFDSDDFEGFTSDLSAFAGREIRIRWRFSSDALIAGEGFYLDAVTVTQAARPSSCLAGDLVHRNGFE